MKIEGPVPATDHSHTQQRERRESSYHPKRKGPSAIDAKMWSMGLGSLSRHLLATVALGTAAAYSCPSEYYVKTAVKQESWQPYHRTDGNFPKWVAWGLEGIVGLIG